VNSYKHAKYSYLEGRNYMEIGDIERTSPNQLKQNRITNIPDYITYCDDVAIPDVVKFKTGRESDPLQPTYKVETKSRRHVVTLGKIDGNQSKLNHSPNTRRRINDISDIRGASPTNKGTSPGYPGFAERYRSEARAAKNLPPIKEEGYGYSRN